MALVKMFSGLITFDGNAQVVATALNLPENKRRAYRLEMQPDETNTAACYYGGSTVATTGIRMEAPETGIPPAPAIWEVYNTGVLDLADFYVKGTNGQKLRVAWLVYV